MPAEILAPTEENLALAAGALRRGELVAMPTETVYGLAADAFNTDALARVFSVKERPTFDPLICHVEADDSPATDWTERLAAFRLIDPERLSAAARQTTQALLSRFWPGPLTLVLPKSRRVPDLATSGLPTVAVRAPNHRLAQRLLAAVGRPLAAPSANRFGRISPTAAEHVVAELGDRIEFILDGGSCRFGVESTVLSIQPGGEVLLLRPGATTSEEIEQAIGRPPAEAQSGSNSSAPESPGRLASHYAPQKPLRILPRPIAELRPGDFEPLCEQIGSAAGVAVLLPLGSAEAAKGRLQHLLGAEQTAHWSVFTLSESGDWGEAARRLFSTLRALDAAPEFDLILVEPVANATGLGYAIADRLARASAAR